MKLNPKQKRDITIGAIVVGGVVLLVVVGKNAGGAPAPSARPSGRRMTPQPRTQYQTNPANAGIAQEWIAAKASLAQSYDQGQTTEYQTNAARQVAFNQTRAQTIQTRIATASQLAIAQAETAAQEQIAQTQATAQEQAAQSAVQAVQAQQPQWWQSLLSGIGSFIPGLFGFSGTSGWGPTGYGTATIPADSGGFTPPPFDFFAPGPSPDMNFPMQVVLPDGTVI